MAVLWQEMFARVAHSPLAPNARIWLFLTAWMIYLADRVADSFGVQPGVAISARQRFCRAHRGLFVAAIVLLGICNLAISVLALDRSIIVAGLIVGGVTVAYLMINHLAPEVWKILPIKELIVGFLFASGTVIAVGFTSRQVLFLYLSFGILCTLNCLSISWWERSLDNAQERISFATEHPDWGKWPELLAWLIIPVGLATIFALGRAAWLSLATAAILLALLNRWKQIPPDLRVALADIALFTPLIFVWLAR